MRVLFVMLHPDFIRYFDGAVRAAAADGHDVVLAFETSRTKLGGDEGVRQLSAESSRITSRATPERSQSVRDFLVRLDSASTRSGGNVSSMGSQAAREEAWESLATTVRLLRDYLRFFEQPFAHSLELRARAEKRMRGMYRRAVRAIGSAGPRSRRACAAALAGIERGIPTNRDVEAFLREEKPDLLLVTPLIELGSQQVDYIKAARRLGIRSALCVASWDNLTSKGLVRVIPDHVIVWNEAQKREAVQLHGVPQEAVIVTGAQPFDRWFGATPSRSREDFCRTAGLDPSRPFVLYVGSSVFIAPDEVPFAERWRLALLDAADPAIRELGVLVRPHPANARQWRAFDPTLPATVIWPPVGSDPSGPDARQDFFDSLYHCAAVVGINTSAQIEASILRRPVFTVRAPEFAHAQAGTLHFQHLVDPQSGFVRIADTLDQHVRQLADGLRDPAGLERANERFVGSFIRPHGVNVPAASIFALALDTIGRMPRPKAVGDPWWMPLSRPFLFALAFAALRLSEGRPLWVYVLRPPLSVAIWAWALAVRVRQVCTDLVVGRRGKQVRRGVHRAWYESSRYLGATVRRLRKRVLGTMRAGLAGARRAVRRQV